MFHSNTSVGMFKMYRCIFHIFDNLTYKINILKLEFFSLITIALLLIGTSEACFKENKSEKKIIINYL